MITKVYIKSCKNSLLKLGNLKNKKREFFLRTECHALHYVMSHTMFPRDLRPQPILKDVFHAAESHIIFQCVCIRNLKSWHIWLIIKQIQIHSQYIQFETSTTVLNTLTALLTKTIKHILHKYFY